MDLDRYEVKTRKSGIYAKVPKKRPRKQRMISSERLLLCAIALTVLSCIAHITRGVLSEWDISAILAESIIPFVFLLAPMILLFVYLTRFHQNHAAPILVPVIFALTALNLFTGHYFPPISIFFGFGTFVMRLLTLPFFVVSIVSSLKGLHKKKISMKKILICILFEMLSIIMLFVEMPDYIRARMYLPLAADALEIFGAISFFIVFLRFIKNNTIPVILKPPRDDESEAIGLSSEDAAARLTLLKEKLELDIITQDEYDLQRAKILRQL